MFTINVKVRNSKRDNGDGTICFVLNEGHIFKQFSSDVRSSKKDVMTDNLDYVLSGIRKLCDIITESNEKFGAVSFEDVTDDFNENWLTLRFVMI